MAGQLLPLAFRPGFVDPGTQYQSKGSWYDGNLVRWQEDVLQPVKPWSPLITGALGGFKPVTSPEPIRGMARVVLTNGVRAMVFGTANRLGAFYAGGISDVTPAGYTPGRVHSDVNGFATVWTFARGATLAVSSTERKLYSGNFSSGYGVATGAPTAAGVFETAEQFIAVFADTRVSWADPLGGGWTPTATNQAGDYDLPAGGAIIAARAGRGETLIWTRDEMFAMRYTGGPLVYGFHPVGSECGLIAPRAVAVVDGRAIWMGPRSFYIYDGFVKALSCPVADRVFRVDGGLNPYQTEKIASVVNARYGEITWFYPGNFYQDDVGVETAENNKYVTYNYRSNIWYTGDLGRTDALPWNVGFGGGDSYDYLDVEEGAYVAAGTDGYVYVHDKDLNPSVSTPVAKRVPVAAGSSSATVPSTPASGFEPTAGEILVAAVMARDTVSAGAMITAEGGLDWTLRSSLEYNTGQDKLYIYTAVPSPDKYAPVSPNTYAVTPTFSVPGDPGTAGLLGILAFTGIDHLDPVVQVKTATGTSTTPTVTMDNPLATGNAYVAVRGGEYGGTSPTGVVGWTQDHSATFNSTQDVASISSKATGSTATVLSCGAMSSSKPWGMIVMELRAASMLARYADVDDPSVELPFAESGPVELGQGTNIAMVRSIVPDEQALGEVRVKLFSGFYPMQETGGFEATVAAFPTSIRAVGRYFRLKVTHIEDDWRVGTFRVDVTPMGKR